MYTTYTQGNVDITFDEDFIQFSQVFIRDTEGVKREFEMLSPEYFFRFFIYIDSYYHRYFKNPETTDIGLLALSCYDWKVDFNEVFDNISIIIKKCGKHREIIEKAAKEKDRLIEDKEEAYWAFMRRYIKKGDITTTFKDFIKEFKEN